MDNPETLEIRSDKPARRALSARSNILFAFAVGLGLYVAFLLRHVLLILYVSALLAVVLTPLVECIMRIRIRRWSPSRGLSILLLMLAAVGSVILFFTFAMPPVLHDLREFTRDLPTRGPRMLDRMRRLPFSSHLDVAALNAKLQGFMSNFAEYLLFSVTKWAGQAADVVMTIILIVYFMIEGKDAYRWILSFFPLQTRKRLDRTLMTADVRMGKWLLGQGLLMLILGVLSTIVFVLLKVRYAYALGVLMGVLNFIPILGAVLSMALVVLAAAIDSWAKVAGVLIFYAIYAQIETSYLTPRIMQARVNLNGLAVLAALLLGGELAGIVGAMVSVPTAVLVAVLVREYLVKDDTKLIAGEGAAREPAAPTG